MTWPFLIFTVLFGAALYLHFGFAHRELRALQHEQPVEINWRYVQFEDYFGRSFRQKLAEWLKLPIVAAAGGSDLFIAKGSERIRVTGSAEYQSYTMVGEILVVNGDFACRARCTFTSEVYVKGDCRIGPSCDVQAIAVDGNLTLGAASTVARWVDSTGALELAEGCRVRARATSRTAIYLALRAQAASLFAPEVATAGRQDSAAVAAQPPDEAFTIPLSGPVPDPGDKRTADFDARKLFQLTPDCWLYKGHLELSAPLNLKAKLIVKGNFSCPAASVLDADVKADGWLHVGERSVCRGSVIATGDIVIGSFTRFEGVVHAGGTLRLCRGVRGGRDEGHVAAYAVERIYVATNVVVRGKLGAGDRVVAVSGPADADAGPANATLPGAEVGEKVALERAAGTWRRRQKFAQSPTFLRPNRADASADTPATLL